MNVLRTTIRVAGLVQGVGFRPFVWRLATSLGCTGSVCNDARGVLIEVQGPQVTIDEFLRRLRANAPSSARITDLVVAACGIKEGECSFAIRDSQQADKVVATVAPDICVCDECLGETLDPANRRYGYPFTNCTNCGPRFTIIETLPYDRSRTTMKGFSLCEACLLEYESPTDRRFHAEPNACLSCGPKIWLVDSRECFTETGGDRCDEADKVTPPNNAAERARTLKVLELVRTRIGQGQIVAIRGVGGFHFACDATHLVAVQTLRERKQRRDKPLAVMVADLQTCTQFAKFSEEEATLLASRQRPIVLLEKKLKSNWLEAVAPKNPLIGVMLAYTPLHYLLMSPGQIWVMTSGNLSDEPIATSNQDAWTRLGSIADAFLFHDRPICVECDDSVLRLTNTGVLPIRRSRGYSPLVISLLSESDSQESVAQNARQTVLAVGGEMKAAICLAIESQAVLSQHIGDMGNQESQPTIERVSKHLLNLYQTRPEVIAADMHPGYFSVQWAEQLAKELSLRLIKIQHHHAHAASLMAEHRLPADAPIIACVFDGTGFGTDGTIWGGEWLIANHSDFRRFAHVRSVPLPGGDACILRPARSALAHLFRESIEWDGRLPCVQTLTAAESVRLKTQLNRGFHCPESTSMGRLFDAVSALAGVRQQINYEGQAAIELESLAAAAFSTSSNQIEAYPFHWQQSHAWELHCGGMLREVVADYRAGLSPGVIGAKFHAMLAMATLQICIVARTDTGIETVGLTGGVFQNILLTRLIRNHLESCGFRVLTHQQVPPNDAGIALGQAVIARAQLQASSSRVRFGS